MKKGGKITPVCCTISSWHMCMKKEEGGKNRKNKESEKNPREGTEQRGVEQEGDRGTTGSAVGKEEPEG